MQRIEETVALASAQGIRASQLNDAGLVAEQRLEILTDRLDRALQWNTNLEARVCLSNLPLAHA